MSFINFIVETLVSYIGSGGYPIIFILMLIESTSLPIIMPAELILITIGYEISIGRFDFALAALVSVLGAVVGALINYCIAKTVGRKVIYKYGKYFFLHVDRIQKLEAVFDRYASIVTFTGRMTPFIKHIISLPAGLCNMPISRFCFWTASGSSVLVLVMLSIGQFIGNNKDRIHEIHGYIAGGFFAFTVTVFTFYLLYDKYLLQPSIQNKATNSGKKV